MSVMGLADEKNISLPQRPVDAPTTGFTDVLSATVESTARNFGTMSKGTFSGIERVNRDKKYRDLTGRNIYEDAFMASPDPAKLQEEYRLQGYNQNVQKAVDDYLASMKEKEPDKYSAVFDSKQLDEVVKTKAKTSLERQAKARAGATNLASGAGQLAGGVIASFADPLNLATLPLGASLATGIFKTALIEAGINAGAEVVSYPFIKQWQNELGQEYGAMDLVQNAGFAALFGAGIGGGTKAVSRGIDLMTMPNSTKLAEMRAVADETGNVELSQALRHEERRLHIEEANPAKYADDINPALHRKILTEVDNAINEGRALNVSRADITDDMIRAMDRNKMDAGTAKFHGIITEKSPVTAQRSIEIGNERIEAPRLAKRQDFDSEVELKSSPEVKSYERQKFDEAFPDERLGEKLVYTDKDGATREITIGEIKEKFKSDRQFIQAATSCGLAI